MAAAPSNGRIILVAGVAAFIGGCWVGMGSEHSGEVFCVVTTASAAARPGFSPGQLIAVDETDSCQPGETQVCGRYEPETGEDRRFVSDSCPD